MKSALDTLIESLEERNWSSSEVMAPGPQAAASNPALCLSVPRASEPAAADPVGDAVRALLKPGEYIDRRGVIRSTQIDTGGQRNQLSTGRSVCASMPTGDGFPSLGTVLSPVKDQSGRCSF
jgi:hypothetical protein